MLLLRICTLYCLLRSHMSNSLDVMEPGQCLSKFDYDYKVLQTLVRLEKEILESRNKIKDLEQIVEECKSNRKDIEQRPSAFMAQLSSNMNDPAINTVVVFDAVITNIGNDYKLQSGMFIAPSKGIYSFNLVATSSRKSRGNTLHLYMMHNNNLIGYIFLDENDVHYVIRSTIAVVTMESGDSVFVKIGHRHGAGTLIGSHLQTHFSGFRIGDE
ncbi:Cerebellin 12 [Mactra antiquata]